MVQEGREKLSGIVEVDETYIEGEEIGTGNKGEVQQTKV